MDVSKFLLFDWNVKWGSFDFGAVDKVNPNLVLEMKEKKCGTMGAAVLGNWIVGLSGIIQIEARELDHTHFEKTIAWNSGSVTTSIPLFPSSFNADEYSYAQVLNLHPTHLASNVTNLDLNFIKAVPRLPKLDADGENPNKNVIEFGFYPDRGQFPNLVYGYLGPVPA